VSRPLIALGDYKRAIAAPMSSLIELKKPRNRAANSTHEFEALMIPDPDRRCFGGSTPKQA